MTDREKTGSAQTGKTPSGPPSSDHATKDMLRAMAHPVRLQMVERVGRLGTARAADIAADMGLPANSVSYHLRILARGGVIEEAPEKARDRRDRVWKLTQSSFDSPAGTTGGDSAATGDEYDAAALAMSFAALEVVREAWRTIGDGSGSAEGMGHMYSTSLRVSAAQAEDLSSRVSELIQDFDRLNRDDSGADVPGDPDSEGEAGTYRVLFTLVRERPTEVDSPEGGTGAGTGGETEVGTGGETEVGTGSGSENEPGA